MDGQTDCKRDGAERGYLQQRRQEQRRHFGQPGRENDFWKAEAETELYDYRANHGRIMGAATDDGDEATDDGDAATDDGDAGDRRQRHRRSKRRRPSNCSSWALLLRVPVESVSD